MTHLESLECMDLLTALWPKSEWDKDGRLAALWKKRLADYPIHKVTAAIEQHRAKSKRNDPVLADVLAMLNPDADRQGFTPQKLTWPQHVRKMRHGGPNAIDGHDDVATICEYERDMMRRAIPVYGGRWWVEKGQTIHRNRLFASLMGDANLSIEQAGYQADQVIAEFDAVDEGVAVLS